VAERNAYQRKLRSDPSYVAKLAAQQRARYANDPEFVRMKQTYNKDWGRQNLAHKIAQNAKRRAAELAQMPKWADELAIRRFYWRRPIGFHVDHIIPLRGRHVSGLHVVENLQYLPASENLKKGARYT
jgi:hypothetical protein